MTGLGTNVILWSPDSSLLLIGGTADQYIVDPDASSFWPWRPCAGVRDPVVLKWAADGRGLFVLQRQGNDPADNGQAVWRCDFDGHRQKVLVAPYTRLLGWMAMSPDERRVLVIDNDRLLLQEAGQPSAKSILSLPMPLGRLVVFWSPDGKWAGTAGQLRETKFPLVPDLILKNLETGAQQIVKVPPTIGVQWWAPSPPATMDTRALVRAALGPGKPFTSPLALPYPAAGDTLVTQDKNLKNDLAFGECADPVHDSAARWCLRRRTRRRAYNRIAASTNSLPPLSMIGVSGQSERRSWMTSALSQCRADVKHRTGSCCPRRRPP
jgi:hypothetical protein